MFVTVQGTELELKPTPTQVYPDYKVYETSDGTRVHLDNNGEVIVYTSYMGYTFAAMHAMNDFVKDLGDRIEIQAYVGGTYHFYRYHICKMSRKPIAYFKIAEGLKENQVDLSAYRIWSSRDMGDYVYISGMYQNKSRIVRKVDNSAVNITEPDGTETSELRGLYGLKDNFAAVCTKNGLFHFDLTTMKAISYKDPKSNETLSYFSKTRLNRSRIEVFKGWRKYVVDPITAMVVGDKFRFSPSWL